MNIITLKGLVLMGHTRLTTTMIYLHVSHETLAKIPSPLDLFNPDTTQGGGHNDEPDK